MNFRSILNRVTRKKSPAIPPKPAELPKTQPVRDPLREHQEFLIGRCMEYLVEMFPANVARHGKSYIECTFPGTDYNAYLYVEASASDRTRLYLTTRIMRPDSDLCLTNLIRTLTEDELKDYLNHKSNVPELVDSLQSLADAMRERD